MQIPDRKKVVLITGAARRIGAAIAQYLHQKGMRIAIHYHQSEHEAKILTQQLNEVMPNSAMCLQADLRNIQQFPELINCVINQWGQLNCIINNASTFYPTPLDHVDEAAWFDLIDTNLKAPLFLIKEAKAHLEITQGCIINISDIHAERPMKNYIIYNLAKAGLNMLTKSLARDLAPNIRVNAIAPGVSVWPEQESNHLSEEKQKTIRERIPLQCIGDPLHIARAAHFLIEDALYTTGQILAIDGGRLLFC